MKKAIVAFLFIWATHTYSLFAQDQQVPLDSAGQVIVLTRELERRMKVFPDMAEFREARLFQNPEGQYFFDVYYQSGKFLYRKVVPLGESEFLSLRQKFSDRSAVLDQEGRTSFVITSTLVSLGYYGWALPASLDVKDGEVFAALYMFSGATGFLFPYMMSKDANVSEASAHLYYYGATRGILHGMMFNFILDDHPDYKTTLMFGILGSIGESTLGFQVARSKRMDIGEAQALGVASDFGMSFGFASTALFEVDNSRTGSLMTLAGTGAGLGTGLAVVKNSHFTRGDAYVWQAVGALGAYIPVAVIDLSNPDKEKPYIAGSMAGAVAGLTAGYYMIRDKDFSSNQGIMINLGELAGGLTGFGLAYLLSSKDEANQDDKSHLFLLSGAAGATAGLWLTYRSFAPLAKSETNQADVHFQFTPQNFVLAKSTKSSRIVLPIASLNIRF